MILRYSRLYGIPIKTMDGRWLGRLADIVIRRQGNQAVAEEIVLVHNWISLLASRFGSKKMTVLHAREIHSITECEIRIRNGGAGS